MMFLRILDVVALCGTLVLSAAAGLSVLGTGVDRSVNRRFALFCVSVSCWAVAALVLRFRLRFGVGNPLAAAQWLVFCAMVEGPLFLFFVARFGSGRSPRLDVLAACFLAAAAAASAPVFLLRVLSDPRMLADGTVRYDVGGLGHAAALVPLAAMGAALAAIVRRRRDLRDWPVPAGAVLLSGGLLLGNFFPGCSALGSTVPCAGVACLCFAVLRRQAFNPLAQEARERRRAEAALQERVEQQELIARIGARTTALLSEESLLRQAVDLVEESFGFRSVNVLLCEGEELVLRAATLPEIQSRAGLLRLRIGVEGITGWVARHGEVLRVPDVLREPRYLSVGEWDDTRSELAVPIRLRGGVIGVLDVQSGKPDAFREAEEETLRTVADQLAVAVQNARLFATVRRDLEERRAAEAVLRESETLFRNVADRSPNLIFLFWRGMIVYANPMCAELSGYAREEICRPGFDALSLVEPQMREAVRADFRKRLRAEGIRSYEIAFRHRTGRRVDTLVTLQAIGYRGEEAVLCIAVDVTGRKRREDLLRALSGAALAMEHAQDPAVVLSEAVRALAEAGYRSILFSLDPLRRRLSLACHAVQGVPVVTEEGDTARFSLAPEDAPFLAAGLALRASAEAVLPPGGLPPWAPALQGPGREAASVILVPLRTGDDVAGVLLIHGDWMGTDVLPPLTDLGRQVAAALRKTALVRDLQKSLTDLRRTQEQLLHAQKMEAVGRLAGGIAHDFNNVLTVISGYVSLLSDALQGQEKAESDLQEIRGAVKRAATLTGRLLSFGRTQVVETSLVDLEAAAAACVKLLRPLIREDVALDLRGSGGRIPVMADPSQMDQVLMNLALNAQDAMPAGGTLRVETGTRTLPEEEAAGLGIRGGPYAVLAVRDTGVGMEDAVRNRIFEPFFTTKGEGKGTGLGLSVVYGIVTQWGGAIRVQSAPGQGSAFTVFLPMADGEGPEAPRSEPSGPLPVGRGTILLAEDDGGVRDLARRILQESGYRVLAAGSGEEAMHIASVSGSIGLLITDVVMPGELSGVDLFHRIRRVRPGLPVLFMSGYADAEDEHYRVPEGQPFLAKPFLPGTFLRLAGELIAGASAP